MRLRHHVRLALAAAGLQPLERDGSPPSVLRALVYQLLISQNREALPCRSLRRWAFARSLESSCSTAPSRRRCSDGEGQLLGDHRWLGLQPDVPTVTNLIVPC